MKKLILYLLITTTLYAQSVYEVVPGTKGNAVVLIVLNESKTDCADKITVTVSNNPKGIELRNNIVQIDKLNPGEERDAVFSFNVKRIPGKEKDTLKFIITDNYGGKWNKEIVVRYSLPTEFCLEQNYPNPFNPTTTISYQLASSSTSRSGLSVVSRVTLKVFDVLGREVATLVDEEKQSGRYEVKFDGSKFSSGTYFYRLQAGEFVSTKKLVLMK